MALFREYDIRGIVDKELTESVAEQIGRAYATMAADRGAKTVSVGRDGRLSSPALRDHLVKGLTAGGLHVVDIGVCPTPILYFSLFHLKVDVSIRIPNFYKLIQPTFYLFVEELLSGLKELSNAV